MIHPTIMLVIAVMLSPFFAVAVLLGNILHGIADAAYTLYDMPKQMYDEARSDWNKLEVDGE
jgi:Na+-driven multidrug efflux pump